MNTNIIISLDKRRARKNGSFPIVIRLSHQRKTLSISTGYSVPEKYWDDRNRKIRTSYKGLKNITRVNNLLEKQKANGMDVIIKLLNRESCST